MSAATITDLTGKLARELMLISDEETRSEAIAAVLEVLAVTVEDTDAYGPLVDVASDIKHQAERNIVQREEDAREHAQQWRASARYRKAVAKGAV